MVSAAIEVEALAFGYPGRDVGAGVSFALAPGEVMCLLGPNGGGKSTLLKTVLGLLPPKAGTIRIGGEDTSDWSPRRRALSLGYVPQSGAAQFAFTVAEMVLMGRAAHRGAFEAPSAKDREIAAAALAALNIGALAERDWLKISGGERQLALIARALAQQPRVLVLDEPTANLDFGNQVRVLAEVRRLAAQGLAVIFATHHQEQAFACADQVAVLHEGRLTRQGVPDAIITTETMRLVYGIEVEIVPVGNGRLKMCIPKDWK
ncbi:MAG TPA: ABC transporter ATP-binding protein [Stellaceae bacterium]|nr:ABC transporter ATP-binding protein [Stellaceae bacterium]